MNRMLINRFLFMLLPGLLAACTSVGPTKLFRPASPHEQYAKSLRDARLMFEHMLGYANHLGLYGEETGPRGEALGNFPQAFTHLALISAAYNLDRTLGGGRS